MKWYLVRGKKPKKVRGYNFTWNEEKSILTIPVSINNNSEKTLKIKFAFSFFFDLIETINQVNFVYILNVHKLLSRKFFTCDHGQVS